jgi:hypothetical protein
VEAELARPKKPSRWEPLRVIRYRPNGARLECPKCRLRFTLPLTGEHGLIETLRALDVVEIGLRAGDQDLMAAFAMSAQLEIERQRMEGVKGCDAGQLVDEIARVLAEAEERARN